MQSDPNSLVSLKEVAGLFLRLGLTAFGGPAAHIAMYHREVVVRRKWMDEQEFLDLLGVTNLIPGPNSFEMAIHLGLRRAGWRGLLAAGVCFVLPAILSTMALAYLYVQYGSMPEANWLIMGIQPVVIAIILNALYLLGRKAVKNPVTLIAGVLAAGLYLLNIHPIPVLVLGSGLVFIAGWVARRGAPQSFVPMLAWLPGWLAQTADFSLARLFFTFLKIGSVLYGSGYVLLAFLHADFVTRLGWLTDQQLVDAIAIGQITPGPVFSTATFIGYLLGGANGAIIGTAGIFLPSFVFVSLVSRFVSRLRNSPSASLLLDGVNAASLGLMAAVTWQLASISLTSPFTWIVAAGALIAIIRLNINTTWLIIGGGVLGYLYSIVF